MKTTHLITVILASVLSACGPHAVDEASRFQASPNLAAGHLPVGTIMTFKSRLDLLANSTSSFISPKYPRQGDATCTANYEASGSERIIGQDTLFTLEKVDPRQPVAHYRPECVVYLSRQLFFRSKSGFTLSLICEKPNSLDLRHRKPCNTESYDVFIVPDVRILDLQDHVNLAQPSPQVID